LKVISSLQLNLSQTYALGDRAIDIQAAHSARIKSCACYWGTNEEMRLDESNPHFKFRTVSEAMEFFEKRLH
jgi:phosphoglycolate phosphatase-like HAD superfamily hydrolase